MELPTNRFSFLRAATISAFCAGMLTATLAAQSAPTNAPAADPAAAAPAPPPVSPELQKKLADTLEAFGNGNYDDALAKLTEADKLRPNDPEMANLRGAIYVKEEKWPQALDAFNKAIQINPKYFPARFNIGEVVYLQKKYPECRAIFEKLAAEDPHNELIQYKIYLSYLLEGNLTEAKARLDKFDFTGNTPAYYYAQAAWLYNQKKVPEAENYISSAIQIFPVQANNLFAESLIDVGWIKRKTPEPTAEKPATP